jgi:repressor LexA
MVRATKIPLTERQQATLDWILAFKKEHGMPPTVREIGRAFGIKSSSAHARLMQLIWKGYLRRGTLGARSLIVEKKS